jgi:hypothetical protein
MDEKTRHLAEVTSGRWENIEEKGVRVLTIQMAEVSSQWL